MASGRRISRRNFVTEIGTAMLTFGFARSALGRAASRKLNILVLVTDDQRWDAIGCAGNSVIRTPNLDGLASEGVLFTNNFVTTSICACSRASIFSGQYMRRHRIEDFKTCFSEAALAETYPLLLRKAGYRIGFIGKWGVGSKVPADKFHYFKGFPGQGKYFHEIDGERVHLTSIMADEALEFLKGCRRGEPFCLSISFKAPHAPFTDFDPALGELYRDVPIPLPKTATVEAARRVPDFIRKSLGGAVGLKWASNHELLREHIRRYYRLITGVDIAIGRIVRALQEHGFYGDTVILFTSDNGKFLGEHGLSGKWLMYEESIRVPLIIRHPRLPRELRGRRVDEMTLNIDIAPTVLEMAGVKIPRRMQGKSLVPLLFGRGKVWREDWFYEHHFTRPQLPIPKSEGVRTRRWKYIRYIERDPPYEELFDLENDPWEKRNLASLPETASTLNKLRERWKWYRKNLV